MALAFKILGPVAVSRDERSLAVGSPKQCTLLVALLLDANRVVSTEHICDLLWEDGPPRSALANLRTYAAALRRQLGAGREPRRLITRSVGYQLRVEPGELDLDTFTELSERGRYALTSGDLETARTVLSDALAIWRGAPAEDAARTATLAPVLDTLAERRAATAEDLLDARLALGEDHALIAELRRLLVAHPLRERLWAQLMTAQYRSGDPAAALAAYSTCRDTLAEQLGLEPGPHLHQLQRAILDRDPALAPRAPAPIVGVASTVTVAPRAVEVPQQLPPDVDTFVGRSAELRWLLGVEPGARIDVSGACGVGKSALVVHAAHALAAAHPDGQLYADLATTSMRPDELAPRFLRVLDPDASPTNCPDEAAARLRSLLADQHVVVVVEGVCDPAHVRGLLPAAGRSTILFTSPTMLTTLNGVQHVGLGPLPVDDAVDLLGALAGPERVTSEPAAAAALAGLCDCLPLALRVAGARLAAQPARPISWLVSRMHESASRLDELVHGDLSVRRCYEETVARLAGPPATVDTLAGRTFRLLGHLGADAVTTSAVAGQLGVPRPDAESALDRLTELRLIDPFDARSYRVRPLVRAYACEMAHAEAQLSA